MTETEYASAEDLEAGDLDLDGGEDLVLPSGKKIRVRGLTRHELLFNGKGTEDSEVIERRNVASAIVVPKMSVHQVEAWQRRAVAGGDFKALSEKIRDLSGLGEGAGKSDVAPDGDD